MTEAIKLCDFQEPVHGVKLSLWSIPILELKNSPYQRHQSTNLRNKLAQSISIGFFSPILVVRKNDEWLIVDGQHRWGAFLRSKGNFPMLAIEIPERFMNYALIYNIEMSDKIKDTCVKVHAMYIDHSMNTPERMEKTLSEFLLDSPYYISLAFAHVEYELSSPSLVETAVKKFDDWLDMPLSDALNERRNRGGRIAALEQTVNEVASRDGITGQAAFQLKSAIVTKTNVALWGRKRSVDESFHEALSMMIEHIYSNNWSFLAG